MLARSLLLKMADSKQLETFVRRNPWSARTASRFVAGETIDEVTQPVKALNSEQIAVSLDLLGESVANEQDVAAVVDTYLRLFQHVRAQRLDANVSVKLTALGIDIDEDFCYRNMARLLTAAGPSQFIRMDMESSNYTQRTLDLCYRLRNSPDGFRNTGVVIQAYLYRSQADIENLIREGIRVRLCKGAYKEPASIAYPNKADVDQNFIRLMQRLLAEGVYPAIATHDPKMIEATKKYAQDNSIPANRFEFQMLYGIRHDLQLSIVQQGYRMRVYTPFGGYWYPYFMRRLAERPANLWFVVKNALHA